MIDESHIPVLLMEAVEALEIKADGLYLDGTFGRGGHSSAIIDRLGPSGRLLASDKDPEAISTAQQRFGDDARFEILHGSFVELATLIEQRGLQGQINGILLDLGVSSPQFDQAERGFSFREDGPLDMRMDTTRGMSASEWLSKAEATEIAMVLKQFGEERFAKRIAGAIVKSIAEHGPINNTKRLAEVVAAAHPRWERDRHPATKSFQAIRIWINQELEDLDQMLTHVVSLLAPQGRLVVISFHSLEDRRIKRFMRDEAKGDDFHPDLPIRTDQLNQRVRLIGRAVRPSAAEVDRNPRSRSAVMRIAERLL